MPIAPVRLQRLARRSAAARPAVPSRGTRRRSARRRAAPGIFGSVCVPSTVVTTFCSPSRSTRRSIASIISRLDVFGVDAAVRADPARQPHREPAAAGAEVGDDAAFADLQRVHDLIGPLPRVAIRSLEQPEILRAETAARAAPPAAPASSASREQQRPPRGSRFMRSSLCPLAGHAGRRHRLGRQDRVELVFRQQPALAHDVGESTGRS